MRHFKHRFTACPLLDSEGFQATSYLEANEASLVPRGWECVEEGHEIDIQGGCAQIPAGSFWRNRSDEELEAEHKMWLAGHEPETCYRPATCLAMGTCCRDEGNC